MQKQTCSSCHFFYQHYVLKGFSCTPTNCGHCGYPRLKHRKPSSTACELFQQKIIPGEDDEKDAFFRYLAEEFIEHLRSQLAEQKESDVNTP